MPHAYLRRRTERRRAAREIEIDGDGETPASGRLRSRDAPISAAADWPKSACPPDRVFHYQPDLTEDGAMHKRCNV